MSKKILFQGKTHIFPDDASEDEIKSFLDSSSQSPIDPEVLHEARKQEQLYTKRFGELKEPVDKKVITPEPYSRPGEDPRAAFGRRFMEADVDLAKGILHHFDEPVTTADKIADWTGGLPAKRFIENTAEGILALPSLPGKIYDQAKTGDPGDFAGALIDAGQLYGGVKGVGSLGKSGLSSIQKARASNPPTQAFNRAFNPSYASAMPSILREVGPWLKQLEKTLGINIESNMPTPELLKVIAATKERIRQSIGPGMIDADKAGAIYNKLGKLEEAIKPAHEEFLKNGPESSAPKDITVRPGWGAISTVAKTVTSEGLKKLLHKGSPLEQFSKAWKDYNPPLPEALSTERIERAPVWQGADNVNNSVNSTLQLPDNTPIKPGPEYKPNVAGAKIRDSKPAKPIRSEPAWKNIELKTPEEIDNSPIKPDNHIPNKAGELLRSNKTARPVPEQPSLDLGAPSSKINLNPNSDINYAQQIHNKYFGDTESFDQAVKDNKVDVARYNKGISAIERARTRLTPELEEPETPKGPKLSDAKKSTSDEAMVEAAKKKAKDKYNKAKDLRLPE